MRYISFVRDGVSSYGCMVEGGVADLRNRTGLPDLAGYVAAHFGRLGAEKELEPDFPATQLRYLPVIPNPSKVLCIAINYYDQDGDRMDPPQYPLLFSRFAASQTGHDEPLPKPAFSEKFDYEGELAVIIGKTAHRVSEDEALSYVAGYSCFMDGSVRDWQKHSTQFTPGKNFARTAGFGPVMVTTDELPNPAGLGLTTRVNGEVRQSTNTGLMIFSIPWLVAYISRFTILEPGDVIVTGTPTGFGSSRVPPVFLRPGDVVEVDIERIGTLRNRVVDDHAYWE